MSNKDHNKGQTDASNGRFKPSVGLGQELRTWTTRENRENNQRNKDYRDGHRHTESQKKR